MLAVTLTIASLSAASMGWAAPTIEAQGESVALPEIVVEKVEATSPDASADYVGGRFGIGGAPGPAQAASAGTIGGDAINSRPVTRPGEVLEAVPGLIVTQHSGEGKANQYFLRGFNLDHGTDIAIHVDSMPVNMRTNAHGQGYADLNFLIPELVGSVDFEKGPYFVRDGDFASAGAVRINYLDQPGRNIAVGTIGSFGYGRALTIASAPLGQGTLLVAGEAQLYDGPWDVPDRLRKINGVARYSQGTAADGFAVTGMAYAAKWTATNQIPRRAVDDGLVDLYGSLDPTDGGDTQRFSLSGRVSRTDAAGATRASAYVIRYGLNLFNDFTYFLTDPLNGDQFHQADSRVLAGGEAERVFAGTLFGRPMEHVFGVQTRTDDIRVGLYNTARRQTLSTVLTDRVLESSGALYYDNHLVWTNWLRTSIGVRADGYYADVRSDTPANSGRATAGIVNPKLGAVLGPWHATELYLNYGGGFHSNDARGVTATVDPVSPLFDVSRSPFLAATSGSEIGLRNRGIAGLETTIALFQLESASENIFQGDTGTTEPSRPSRRVGIEVNGRYAITPWLVLDAEVTATHARFTEYDAVGSYIPEAPALIAAAGVTAGAEHGWFGALRFRYFGPRPLSEDNAVRSRSTSLVNGRLGYNFANGVSAQLDVLNLLNSRSDQITYFYQSRLPGEGPDGVFDTHFKPVEPIAARFTLAARF